MKRDYKKLTKQQFLQKMAREPCKRVVQVDEQPSQVMAVEDCADTAVDIDDVQLQDGMRLAVVANVEDSTSKLMKSVSPVFQSGVSPVCVVLTCYTLSGLMAWLRADD